MNTYLIKSKVELIKEAKQDFLNLYGVDYTPFTRKIYFYFFEHGNKKYIHRKSLRFVYTNADTYTQEVDPYFCFLSKVINPPNVEKFLIEYKGDLLPKLIEVNDKFLVYEYFEGDPVDNITLQEFKYLEKQHDIMHLTPFYNSMTYNLCRNKASIKLIDFKHFELKKDLPFFLYLYNEQNCVNTLYIQSNSNIDKIREHLIVDYPVDKCCIIKF